MVRRFNVGDVIAESFQTLFANFVTFMAIALLVKAPILAWAVYVGLRGPSTTLDELLLDVLAQVVDFILTYIVTAAITFGVIQSLRREPVSFGRCVSVGLSRIFVVLGAAIVVGLVTLLGLALFIVPGLIFMCMYWVTIPVAVVERKGVFASMGRSTQLSEGTRWRILGVAALIILIQIAFLIAVVTAITMAGNLAAAEITAAVVAVLFTAWQASAQAVSYYHLRSSKEMIDVDQIAAVFD